MATHLLGKYVDTTKSLARATVSREINQCYMGPYLGMWIQAHFAISLPAAIMFLTLISEDHVVG
jgi:hypothetical protein